MIHLLLLLVCILSVEVFIRLNFLSHLDSILKVTKRVTYVIPNNNISDHWKEKVIPCICIENHEVFTANITDSIAYNIFIFYCRLFLQ